MYSRVYVEITNICNMNCSFCHGHNRTAKNMDNDEFLHVLDQLNGITQYIYFHLMGEPLLHPQLLVFIKEAKDRGFKPMITTNGTLLSKYNEALINAELHKINISVHSFENGDERSQQKYLQEITDFTSKAAEKGTIIVLRLWNNGFDQDKNDITLTYLHSKFKNKWTQNTRGFKIRENLFLEYGERFEWPDIKNDICGEKYFCYGLRDHFGILCDGTVVPCCLDSDGVINLGNIFKEDLSDILSSPRALAIKDAFSCQKASEQLCKKCGYAQRFV